MTETRLYRIWRGMKRRCYTDSATGYKQYGGRGIGVCAEWQDFASFRQWSIENGYSDELTIDRIDNDGNYEPDNCRWVTQKEQANNRSNNSLLTAFGECKTLSEWSEDPRCKVQYIALKMRKMNGWTSEAAIATPPDVRERFVEAFGEINNLSEWSKDPRCSVGYYTLKSRIRNGWTPEAAISTPSRRES